MKPLTLGAGLYAPNRLIGVPAVFITILLTFSVLPETRGQNLFWTGTAASPATAGSGTWVTPEPPGFFSWSSSSTSFVAANWADGSVAHFLGSNGGTATLGSSITAAAINFDPGANSFTIDTNLNLLTIDGSGIVNNSGKTQTIINTTSSGPTFGGETNFINASTAGNVTIINNGPTSSGSSDTGGITVFNNTSTAGSATITNNGAALSIPGFGGEAIFHDSSTAGSATITNNGGLSVSNSGGPGGTAVGDIGATQFFETSTAGNATITNNGGTAGGEIGGVTFFHNASTAGSARIINNGASVSGAGGAGSLTVFFDTSTAANASIINNGGTATGAAGGATLFSGNPSVGVVSAGGATITNNGGTVSGARGGTTEFLSSTAGNATIITNGGTNGGLGGTTIFIGTSDGGTARAITNGNGIFDISGLSTPGMAIGSIAGSGIYSLGGKTLTVGGNNSSTTVSGVITGTGGSLTKVGTGTLTLTSPNTYTGATTVNAGSLIVDGSIASPQTFVNVNASLGGHGTIGGNLVNSGRVGPTGTLTVAGNYTQTPGGTLLIGVLGLAPNQHSLLAVNGHMTLGGTLQIVRLGNFNLQPGNQITFLTANQGVSGNFSTVQNDFATGTAVVGSVVLQGNNIVLTTSQGSFTSIPTLTATPNLNAVAKALDSAIGDPRAAALIGFLNSQPVANLPHDLTLIAPTQISSTPATGQAVGKVQVSNIGQRLANIRAGATGFSASGFAISGAAASIGEGFAGPTGSEGKGGSSVLAPSPGNRWGVFLTGLGEFTNVDSTPNAAGYNVDTGGFTLGVDYRLTPNFALGFTAGYAHTTVNLDGGGDIDVNGGKLGFYATAFANGFYLDTAVSGGPSGYNTHRTALQGTASGDTNGADFNFLVATGYDWKKGDLTIGPTASFQFSYTSLDGFTETGSLAPLKFPSQNYESERSAFGAKASYDWKVGHITVIPQVSAAWQHEYGSAAYTVTANFANGAGNSFTVSGPQIGRDSLLIGAGASVVWNDRVTTYLYYDGEVARTNYQSHNVSGGVRISF
jgi:uncharacterized protein with beta-barrel porin domain